MTFRFHLAFLPILFATLPGFAQLVVNYTNNQVNHNAYSTSAPNNPLILNLDYGYANQQGVISGTGALIKTGAGRLLLHDGVGSNTYSGGTTVSGGTLVIWNARDVGTGPVTLTTGGTLEVSGGMDPVSLNLAGGTLKLSPGHAQSFYTMLPISMTNISKVDVDGTGLIAMRSLSGTGGLQKIGSGLLSLSGTNTYSGGTILSSGSVSWNAPENFGTGTITVESGVRLRAAVSWRSLTQNLHLAGGTLALEGYDFSSTAAITLSNASAIETPWVHHAELGGVVSGTGSLLKVGTGTLTLSGANSHSGGTKVSDGTIRAVREYSLGTGPVEVTSGGRLMATNNRLEIPGHLTVDGSDASFTSNGVIALGFYNTASFSVLNGATMSTTSELAVGMGVGANVPGLVTGSNSTLTVGSRLFLGGAYGTGSITIEDGGTVQAGSVIFAAAGGNGSLTIRPGGILKIGGTNAIYTEGPSTLHLAGGLMKIQGQSLTTAHPITLSSTSTIDTNGFGASLAGVLSGTGSLAKVGSGTLTLSGSNTHSGGTFISAGQIKLDHASGLGRGPISLTSGAQVNGGNLNVPLNQEVTVTGSGSVFSTAGYSEFGSSGTSRLVITDGGSAASVQSVAFGVNAGGHGTGSVTGTGSALDAGGTLFLGAFNGAGTLEVGAGGQARAGRIVFGYYGGSGTLTIKPGGTVQTGGTEGIETHGTTSRFDLAGGTLKIAGTNLTTSTPVILSATSVIDTNGLNAALSGAITGTGGLVKSGTGTLTLSGLNTYAGGTVITAGTVQLGHSGSSLLSTSEVTIQTGTLALGAANETIGSLTGVGTVQLFNGTGRTLTVSGSSHSTFAGVITGAGGSLVKAGLGTLTLTGTNTYSGGTVINGGVLQLGDSGSSIVSTGAVTIQAGSLALGAANQTIGSLAGDGGTVQLFNGTGRTLTVSGSSHTLFAGVITGEGGSLVKAGPGTLTLSGPNTYSGGTVIEGGTLQLGYSGTSLLSTGAVTIHSGTFALGTNTTIGSLAGNGGTVNLFRGAGRTLTVSGSSHTTFDGVITGMDGTFVKAGPGSLTLSGHHTYTGGTVVEGGALIVDGSLSASSEVYVSAGGTLGGQGTVGTTIIAQEGAISPGHSPGTLITGNQYWYGDGRYVWELNDASDAPGARGTTYDWLDVRGTLDLNSINPGQFTIAITSLTASNMAGVTPGFVPHASYQWIIASATNIDGFSAGLFTLDTSGFANAPDTTAFSITSDGSHLLLNYVAVPEPSTLVSVAAGLLGLIILLRRHRGGRPPVFSA